MKYLLIIPASLLLVACCGENYVKEMTVLSKNIQQQVVTFYKHNKRFPTIQERNKILENASCVMKSQDVCSYNGRNIRIKTRLDLGDYDARFYLGKNFCYFAVDTAGKPNNVSCRKDDCISLKQ